MKLITVFAIVTDEESVLLIKNERNFMWKLPEAKIWVEESSIFTQKMTGAAVNLAAVVIDNRSVIFKINLKKHSFHIHWTMDAEREILADSEETTRAAFFSESELIKLVRDGGVQQEHAIALAGYLTKTR